MVMNCCPSHNDISMDVKYYNGEKPPILLFSYPFWQKQVMLPKEMLFLACLFMGHIPKLGEPGNRPNEAMDSHVQNTDPLETATFFIA
jgi:hypothetical protein